MKVSAMASMMALRGEGHLNAAFEMFLFIKSKHNKVIVFDPTDPEVYQTQFATVDWSTIPCITCKEDVPSNVLAPRGMWFTMRVFFTLAMLDVLLLVAQELAVSCSSMMLLSLFTQRIRGVTRHQVLVRILLQ